MAAAINPCSHAADNGHAGLGEMEGNAFRHRFSIRRTTAGAYDGNGGLGRGRQAAAAKQPIGRVVNVAQFLWVIQILKKYKGYVFFLAVS